MFDDFPNVHEHVSIESVGVAHIHVLDVTLKNTLQSFFLSNSWIRACSVTLSRKKKQDCLSANFLLQGPILTCRRNFGEFRAISGRSSYPQKPASNAPENFGERSERISGNFGEFRGISGSFGEFRGISGNFGESHENLLQTFRGISGRSSYPQKPASNAPGNFGERSQRISGNFGEFRGVSGNFGEFRAILGNFGRSFYPQKPASNAPGNFGKRFRGISGNFGEFRGIPTKTCFKRPSFKVSGNFGEFWAILGNFQGTSEKGFGEFRGISGNPTKTCFKHFREFRGISGRSANPQKPASNAPENFGERFRGISGNFGEFRGTHENLLQTPQGISGNFGEVPGSPQNGEMQNLACEIC